MGSFGAGSKNLGKGPHQHGGMHGSSVSGGVPQGYGSPGGSSGTSGGGTVVFQLLCDEASGSLTDEVNSIVLAAVSSPVYSVAVSSPSGITPAIECGAGNFAKGSAATETDPLTNDWVVEIWLKSNQAAGANEVVYETDRLNNKGWQWFFTATATSFQTFLKTDEGTTFSDIYTIPDIRNDGLYHHLRWSFDRDGNAEMFVDNVTVGTNDMSGHAAENYSGVDLSIGATSTGSLDFVGDIAEVRQTHGTTTANSWDP